MRGIGHTLSRLPKARALLAGAAILAGAFTSAAHGQPSGSGNGTGAPTTDETRAEEAALAIPRISLGSAPSVAFPRPLLPSDAATTRRIFAYQAHGDIASAIRSTAELENPLLLGAILADRYTGRYHRSTEDELLDWLKRFPAEPDAPAIHNLLLSRLPKSARPHAAPVNTPLDTSPGPEPMPEDIDVARDDPPVNPVLERTILARVQRGNIAAALRMISTNKAITPAYASELRAKAAHSLFIQNKDVEALRVARLAISEAPDQAALAFYVGGLAAWRLDRIEQAAVLFEAGANAPNASAHLRAASAFWASRAFRSTHDAVSTVKWLKRAAAERFTFHGLLARRILHMNTGIPPNRELLAQADVDAVAATAGGWRAFALLQAGLPEKAEAELKALWPQALENPLFGRSLMMVAAAAGLTECSARMASLLPQKDGQPRFPLPKLHPAGGFSIDPALVYALTRVESNFDSTAVSPAGARGLMQIMPATAQYITGNVEYQPDRLHEPAANLRIGQSYLAWLARQDGIGNDLLRILSSYNSGPGGFFRWAADINDHDDPLLFLEAIPVAETRTLVQHALLYSWLYAARMQLPAPSLDELAAGQFPRFTASERERSMPP